MSTNHCPKCALPLENEQPCPACMLAFAAETEVFSQDSPSTDIDIELIREAFPQLEIVEMIGRGGMGTVFKARQPKLDRFVALKILSSHLAGRDDVGAAFSERFAREGKLLARLGHPNIVAVYDFGQTEITVPDEKEPVTYFYLVMEFVDGVDLRHAMREERFSPEQALAIVPKICDALQYAHEEGVLHRDIKPENILLDVKGRVKIADFGIASTIFQEPDSEPVTDFKSSEDHQRLTRQGQVLGTPQYMAPEQLQTPDEIDARADVYSLGVVFYELLTGQLPQGRFPQPSESAPVGAEVDRIVRKALEKNRDSRYQSAEEFKTEILVTQHLARDPQKRDRRRAALLLLITFFLVALLAFFALNDPPPEREVPRRRAAVQTMTTADETGAPQELEVDEEFLKETRRRMTMAWFIAIVLLTIILVQYIRRHRRTKR